MDKVTNAADRLDKALSRLEGSLDSLFERAGDPGVVRRELAALVADRAKLADELDEALAREQRLQTLADEASEALGAAIEEVRSALNREGTS